MLKDEKKFAARTKFIPIIFFIVWIIMMLYTAYEAPSYPDEGNGNIYAVTIKSKTVYLTLTEEILMCGSILGAVLSFAVLQITSSPRNNEKE